MNEFITRLPIDVVKLAKELGYASTDDMILDALDLLQWHRDMIDNGLIVTGTNPTTGIMLSGHSSLRGK